jgi:hypothetical protein
MNSIPLVAGTAVVATRLSPDLLAALDEVAAVLGMRRGQFARFAIKKAIEAELAAREKS